MQDEASQAIADKQFLDECRPKLEELEGIRVEKYRIFKLRKKLAVPLAAVLTPIFGFIDYLLLMLQRGNEDTAVGLTAVVLGGLWYWVTKPKRDYNKAYKTDILPEIASLFGDFTYDVKGKIPMAAMKPSKIVPRHNGYKSEDHFAGNYKGVGIEFSEIVLTQSRGKQTHTVFKGLGVLLSQGTRKFQGHTILIQDQGKVSKWLKKQTSGLKRANMVDLEFERMFDVFTDDQVEARYLIDPVIIENLKALYSDYSGTKLYVSFYDNHVLILIGSNANHFEPANIDVPATNETELLAMKHEIAQIISIVDQLSLYDPEVRRKAEARLARA